MKNGGQVGSRGYIFQAIIAFIECLGRDDWDAIKNEPNTDEDKVDIMLYREDGTVLSAIQVKSSINKFERADVEKWLESLKKDAGKAECADADKQEHMNRLIRVTLYIIVRIGTLGGKEILQAIQKHISAPVENHSQKEEHHSHSCHKVVIIPHGKAAFSHRYRTVGQKNPLLV